MVPEIYGRDEELARVRAFVHGTGRPNAGMVLEGEAGIGKSTLWLAAVELARDEGFHVLTARTAEAERHLAYVGLSDLLEPVVDDVFRQLSSPRRTSPAGEQLAFVPVACDRDLGPGIGMRLVRRGALFRPENPSGGKDHSPSSRLSIQAITAQALELLELAFVELEPTDPLEPTGSAGCTTFDV